MAGDWQTIAGLVINFVGFALIMASGGLSYHPQVQEKAQRSLVEKRSFVEAAGARAGGAAVGRAWAARIPRSTVGLMHEGNRYGFVLVLVGLAFQTWGAVL